MTASVALLEKLAATVPEPPELPPFSGQRSFDAERFISTHLDVLHTKSWNGGIANVLNVCPFNDDHTDKSAVVIQHSSGALSFKCHHNGCADKKWSDVRELFEPKAAPKNGHKPVAVAEMDRMAKTSVPAPPQTNVPEGTAGEGEHFPLTDLGNAERLVARHGDDLRYVGQWGHYLHWDDVRWRKDETGEIIRRAKDTVRAIYVEAKAISDPDKRQEMWKHAVRSESGPRVREMTVLAQAEPIIAAEAGAFDSDPMLLTCPNGTLDLRTGTLRPHDRSDHISKSVSTPFNEHARAPTWEKSLHTWTAGNEDLIAFLQRALGYSLTGLTVEEVIFFLWGLGRNGKSKFLAGARHVFGDYGQTVRPEALMVKQGSDIPNEVASLVGARMVTTIEIEDGARLAESLVKQLTGGDLVSARFMRQEFFEFRPVMKIWMAGNHKPNIRGADPAMWERILTIPFKFRIPTDQRDKDLEEKLRGEAMGILAWMVAGCLEWQRIGLRPPDEVRQATKEYRDEMDVLGQFIEDCCEEKYDAVILASQLYERYEDWCKSNGERQWSQQLFGRKLGERGFENSRAAGLRVWQGLDLKHDG